MGKPILAIANRNYSSWSLRAWLHLRLSHTPFDVVRLPLNTPEWDRRIGEYSPSGRLPALVDGDLRVWDSFAIILHTLERVPGALGWPSEPEARAAALSICAEMHSGFASLRTEMPMNCRLRVRDWPLSGPAREDVARVQEIWESCRIRFGSRGPYLFGSLSVADVMYAPVALRFITYAPPLRPPSEAYAETIQALPEVQEWIREARAEVEVMEEYEPVSKG